MDDRLITLDHGYALVQVVLGGDRSAFLAFTPGGRSLGRFPTRDAAEEAADEDCLSGPHSADAPVAALAGAEPRQGCLYCGR